jgi:hypothetical protein
METTTMSSNNQMAIRNTKVNNKNINNITQMALI